MKSPGDGERFDGWRLLAALCVIQVATVSFPMYGGAVLHSALVREFKVDVAIAGLPISTFMLVVGFSAPVVAWLIDRIGARWVIAGGCAGIVAGALGMATLARGIADAAVLYGVVVGAGVGMGGILASQTLATRWFSNRRTLAISLLLSTISVGGFLAPPALDMAATLSPAGWRAGWLVVAALALGAGVLSALLIREDPARLGQRPDGGAPAPAKAPSRAGVARTSADIPWAAAVRTPAFWIIALAVNVFSATLSLVLAHGIAHVMQKGYSSLVAAFTISTVIAASLCAKFVAGLLGDRFDPRLIWTIGLAFSAAGLAVAAYASSGPALLYAYPIAVGLGVGAAPVCMMALIADYFGKKRFPALSATIIALQTLTGFVAPMAAGRLTALSGDYRLAFLSAGALALVACACLFFMRPPAFVTTPSTASPHAPAPRT